MKRIPWVCFEITQFSNHYEARVTDPELRADSEFFVYEGDPKECRVCTSVTRSENNIDRDTYEYTIAKSFFDAVRTGRIVCTRDTRVRIILRLTSDAWGNGPSEKYISRWGTIDYFEVPKDKFPHGPALIKELVSQIKSCRHLMQGELDVCDNNVIQDADRYMNDKGWKLSGFDLGKF